MPRMESIATELVDTGEKRDALGRRIVPQEQRAAMIAAYEASGLTQAEFARREGISFWSFAKWISRNRAKARPQPAKFAEVSTLASRPSSPLEVALPNGMVIRGGDVEQLAALAQRLR